MAWITSPMSMQELNKLTASDGASDDNFGFSVAIDGDTAIIGAINDDEKEMIPVQPISLKEIRQQVSLYKSPN